MSQKNFHLLAQKYGHAFILINNAEFLLEILLFKKGGLYQIDQILRDELLNKTTMGRKHNLSRHLIENKKLNAKIEELIKKGNKMAHRWLTPFSGKGADDWVFIGGGKIAEKVDENFFDETIKLAYDVVKQLIPISGVENMKA